MKLNFASENKNVTIQFGVIHRIMGHSHQNSLLFMALNIMCPVMLNELSITPAQLSKPLSKLKYT